MHRFMVVGENADFMDATLEAGKTYYVVAAMRPGYFASRFSLWPMRADPNAGDWSIHGEQFKEWMSKTTFVALSPASSQRWYDMNKAMVDKKKAGFLKKWNVMDAADRAELTLNAEDGV